LAAIVSAVSLVLLKGLDRISLGSTPSDFMNAAAETASPLPDSVMPLSESRVDGADDSLSTVLIKITSIVNLTK
jgi:hypothetical protein